MKQIFISSAILSLALQASAFAQSTTSVVPPTSSAAMNGEMPSAATSTAQLPNSNKKIAINYLGIYEGPTLSENTKGKSLSGDQAISNRTALQYNISKDANVGFQTRFKMIFDAKQGFRATSENHRFYGNLKNVASIGDASVNLTAKAILPTANSSHNSTMRAGAEFMPTFNLTPKDSRFTFSYAPQFQQYIYNNADKAHDMEMPGSYLAHNFEVDYQMSGTAALNVMMTPEYYTLSTVQKYTNRSNELDVGVNWDFAKGWSVFPYIGAQLNGFEISDAGKNMEVALTLSGAIL